MTEILFYHLESHPLERVLPQLLEKCLERGWKSVVQAGSVERVRALDSHLWTWRDGSFLPHGTREDGNEAHQPVFLTDADDCPNGAQVRFLVDGTSLAAPGGYERVVYLFDGQDETALAAARASWREMKEGGQDVTYWQQDDTGKWVQKA
jgi:DNA polymerase-3 subunit chi